MIQIKNKFFNTSPTFFHHNGRPSLFRYSPAFPLKAGVFKYMSNGTGQTFQGRKEKVDYLIPHKREIINEVSSKVTILMISNLKEYGSAARCLEYYGFLYTVIGKEISKFDGWEKFKKIVEFIPTVETEYLMILDSDDVFIVDGIEDLINNYEEEFHCKMLFNAEAWCFPKGNQELRAFEEGVSPKDSPNKYLNSGVMIANVEFLKSIYDTMINIEPYSKIDQAVFKHLYKMYFPEIKIDHRCKYFQSVPWSGWLNKYYPGRMDLELVIG